VDDETAEGTAGVDSGGTGKPIQVVMIGKDVRSPSMSTPSLGSTEEPPIHTILVYPY
jgi:hypothetical protein